MVLATDRLRTPLSGPALVAAGLTLGLGVLPGCARLQTNQSTPTSAVLGVERPDNNYSSYHTARSTAPGAAAGLDPSAPIVPQIAGIDPLPPGAVIAAEPLPATTAANAAPAADAGVAATRLVSAHRGVPEAARLIAAGARPADVEIPPVADQPATSPAAAEQDPARLVAESRAAIERMASYQAKLHRQERVGSNLLPAEDLVLSIRRQPRAIRLSWPTGPSQGREAIYRAEGGDGLMHVHMGKGSLVPRMNLAPDSPLVLRNSRHPITEAGFEPILADLERAIQDPNYGTLASLGTAAPAPLDRPHPGVARTNAAGEVAQVFFDPDTHLPALVEVKTAGGDLLEHYVFRDVQIDPVELAEVNAFDPDNRWGQARGLFGRVARGNDAGGEETPR